MADYENIVVVGLNPTAYGWVVDALGESGVYRQHPNSDTGHISVIVDTEELASLDLEAYIELKNIICANSDIEGGDWEGFRYIDVYLEHSL